MGVPYLYLHASQHEDPAYSLVLTQETKTVNCGRVNRLWHVGLYNDQMLRLLALAGHNTLSDDGRTRRPARWV